MKCCYFSWVPAEIRNPPVSPFFKGGLCGLGLRVAEQQPEALRRAAHTLKSNARNFGATTLGELCQELESQAKHGELEGAEDLLERIEQEYKQVRTALGVVVQW